MDPMPCRGGVGGAYGVEPGVSHDSLLVVICVTFHASCPELAEGGGQGGGKGEVICLQP